jgi:uncharacterized protein
LYYFLSKKPADSLFEKDLSERFLNNPVSPRSASDTSAQFIMKSSERPLKNMAKFECSWCGKCCASFGQFIKIERQLNDWDYYCRYSISGDVFPVHVLPEYAGDFADEFEESGDRRGKTGDKCIFMRKNQDGKGFACIIYPTRPQICREFRCYRMLIHHREGHQCGRIIGRNELKSNDEELVRIWNDLIIPLPHHDDSCWEREVIVLLSQHGYRGEPAE